MDKLNIKLARMRATLKNTTDLNITYGAENVKTNNIRFINSVNGDMEIDIFGDIGDTLFEDNTKGYTFEKFKMDLSLIESDIIVVNIKSRGGDAFEALAIYDELRNLSNKGKHIITNIVGTTASAGTIIALAGDTRTISLNSNYLIHKARIQVFGNAAEMKGIVQGLEDFDEQLMSLYNKSTGLSLEELNIIMDKDEFMTAQQAVDYGFCTDIMNMEVLNKINNIKLSNKMKAKFAQILNVKEEEVEDTIEVALTEKEELANKLNTAEENYKNSQEELANVQAQLAALQAKVDEEAAAKEAEELAAKEAKEEEEVMNILNSAVESNKLTNDAIPTWKGVYKNVGKESFVNMINSIPARKEVTNFKNELDTTDLSYQNKQEVIQAWKSGKINTGTYQNLVKSFK